MDTQLGLIEVERQGEALVLTPDGEIRERDYWLVEEEQRELLLRLAEDSSIRHVVVDFGKTDCFGSTVLNLLVRLWRVVRERGGRVALCNVSAHEKEIFNVTRLDEYWLAYASREQAVEAVEG